MNEVKIKQLLASVEQTQKVNIILAVESGSRAWGFASEDSDYDVRFIYCRPLIEYLRVMGIHKDTIEYTPEELMDFSGWDIAKALRLFVKSNPAMIEWLLSPINYVQRHLVFEYLQSKIKECYDPVAGYSHHSSLIHNTIKRHVVLKTPAQEPIKAKKLLYILRSLANMQYILKHGYVDTIVASELISASPKQEEYRQVMEYLICVKKQTESSCVEYTDDAVQWLLSEYEYFDSRERLNELPKRQAKQDELVKMANTLFLQSVWPSIPI